MSRAQPVRGGAVVQRDRAPARTGSACIVWCVSGARSGRPPASRAHHEPARGPSLSSYQSLCNEDLPQRRHDVHCHWWLQPGQRPCVENVFHTMPHPSKNGSGVPPQSQHQRLEYEGRQLQSGHRIPTNGSSWSGTTTLTVFGSEDRSSLNNNIGVSVPLTRRSKPSW